MRALSVPGRDKRAAGDATCTETWTSWSTPPPGPDGPCPGSARLERNKSPEEDGGRYRSTQQSEPKAAEHGISSNEADNVAQVI